MAEISQCLRCKAEMPERNSTGKKRKYCTAKCANAYYNSFRKRESVTSEIDRVRGLNKEMSNFILNLSDRWELLYEIATEETRELMNFVENELGVVLRLPVSS